jgi:hypothetical protein
LRLLSIGDVRLKLRRGRGFRRTEIEVFAKRSLDAGCAVVAMV